jgi:hypothetical protein
VAADEAIRQLDLLGAVILDDDGNGPSPDSLAAAATRARDAVAQLAVPALTQLGGLIAGVAQAVMAGTTEWSPSLGGTLMAAVDDLRHLAGRASQFSDEDTEHLHHRASELSGFAASGGASAGARWSDEVPAPREAKEIPVVAESEPALQPPPSILQPQVIPISDLFYADNGPHIVSGGTPAAAASKSDLLGRGIEALDNLTMRPIATRVSFGSMEVVPVETLLYRGRAALERAAAIREQIKISGGVPAAATLDEMYDLSGLALKD